MQPIRCHEDLQAVQLLCKHWSTYKNEKKTEIGLDKQDIRFDNIDS